MQADQVSQNGIFHVTFPESTFIYPGDQISLKMVLINDPVDPGSIIITQNLPITASFSRYDVDYSKDLKTLQDQTTAWPAATFDYYAGYSSREIVAINNIILSIKGFIPPINSSGRPDYTVPGGSYIVPLPFEYPYTVTDPLVGWYCIFSYIDDLGNLQLLYCTLYTNVKKYNVSDPHKGLPTTLYGMMSGAEYTTQYGVTVADGDVLLIPVTPDLKSRSTYPDNVRKGTLKLVSVNGGWPGGSYSFTKDTQWTYPSDDQGSTGAYIAGTKSSANPYDIDSTNNKLNAQFSITQFYIKSIDETVTPGSNQLDIDTTTSPFDTGKYTKGAATYLVTQKFIDSEGIKPPLASNVNQIYISNNPLMARVDDPSNPDLLFRRIDFSGNETNIVFDDTNTYVYYDTVQDEIPPLVYGAQQFAIEYGKAGDSAQLSYAHMPMQEDGQPNEQMVAIYYTGTQAGGDLRYHDVKSASGVVFHDLQPVSFWKQLGLYDVMICPLKHDENGIAYYDREQFLEKITYGLLGLDGFPIAEAGGNFRIQAIEPAENPTFENVTGASRALYGKQPSQDTTGGCYYIEIIGLRNQSGVLDSKGNRTQISALVSGEYSQGDIVTGYSDSSIPIIHEGAPYCLSDVWVRILGRANKLPISTLGPLNTVFLQVDRAQPIDQENSKPPPKKK